MSETFGESLRRLRKSGGIRLRELADQVPIDPSRLSRWENDKATPSVEQVAALDDLLHARGELRRARARAQATQAVAPPYCTDLDALDLNHRATASDVGTATLDLLDAAVEDLAVDYPTTPPDELLPSVAEHLDYVGKLLTEGRLTLTGHRRLLVSGGWLSLLAATLNIDLLRHRPASGWLRTAASLAREAGHPEIIAWCYETEAWRVLTNGDPRRAVELSRAAQRHALAGSSAEIQATAQEGRALARLGDHDGTHHVVAHVHTLAAHLDRPDRPEHHFRYDPDKATAYTATTLAWLGDAEAERYAREVIDRYASTAGRARRYASAHTDLALIKVKQGELDAAIDAAQTAIATGAIAPSNYWRLGEVVTAVRALPKGREVRDAYQGMIND